MKKLFFGFIVLVNLSCSESTEVTPQDSRAKLVGSYLGTKVLGGGYGFDDGTNAIITRGTTDKEILLEITGYVKYEGKIKCEVLSEESFKIIDQEIKNVNTGKIHSIKGTGDLISNVLTVKTDEVNKSSNAPYKITFTFKKK